MKNSTSLKNALMSLVSDSTLKSDDPYRKFLPEFISMICGNSLNKNKNQALSSDITSINDFLILAAEKSQDELKNRAMPDFGFPADDSQLWQLFHPEAPGIKGRESDAEKALRDKRTVKILKMPENPVTDPGRQILFTSNILLTLPTEKMFAEKPDIAADMAHANAYDISPALFSRLKEMRRLPQKYWYDHPIPMGISREHNEVLYGLDKLDKAVAFEKIRGVCDADIKIPVLLSVSVTHPGLDEAALDYLQAELEKAGKPDNLDIFVFGEKDTRDLIEKLLIPAALAGRLSDSEAEAGEALGVFGVDGEYGRHYSFLKAIAALWRCLINPEVKGVFKIDLDQVFDQEALTAQTGMSAFELLSSPLWGASGLDWQKREVFLGMIAGALVNEKDIHRGLFTPDVDYPDDSYSLKRDEKIFYSRMPQALSTRAEMMCRYGKPGDGKPGDGKPGDGKPGDAPDGKTECLQRIHVTGGTNGILIEALHKWRPFTPSFIGRAEDQAYILSSFTDNDVQLAYLHQPGLIMRHDKEAFAAEAIQAAAMGKQIGDYVRILLFSKYAQCLPGGKSAVKERIDPFTGSFVSYMPVTTAVLRLLLKAEEMFENNRIDEAREFIRLGAKRLGDIITFADLKLEKQLIKERKGWNLFYDIMEFLSSDKSPEMKQLCGRAAEKILGCRLVSS